ncbi:hypothetical protein [Streptomyces sp. NPDC058620]|uniref:hypothetical protein n=1 Tax=Streptomyces sp. NPDC058620 TaxID=3346560 RepID=UPI00365494EA
MRCVALSELWPADLRTLISQGVALAYVLPLAVRLPLEQPLLDALLLRRLLGLTDPAIRCRWLRPPCRLGTLGQGGAWPHYARVADG